jgi:hypothetical protein
MGTPRKKTLMTLNEFALVIRSAVPEVKDLDVNNEALAHYYLKRYPKYWDAISPTARQINDLIEAPIESQRWTEAGRQQSYGTTIHLRESQIKMLHTAEMVLKANSMGVPTEILGELAIGQSHHEAQKELLTHQYHIEKQQDEDSIILAERRLLVNHQVLTSLQTTLNNLIDQRDKETHPDKKKVLDIRISNLMEELDARAKQAVVQAGGGGRLRDDSKEAKRDRDSREDDEGNLEPLPVEKPRMGF